MFLQNKKSTEGQIMKYTITFVETSARLIWIFAITWNHECTPKTLSDTWHKNTKICLHSSTASCAITMNDQKSLYEIQIHNKNIKDCHTELQHTKDYLCGFVNELQLESNSSRCCRITCDRLTGSGRIAHSFWMA